MAIGRAVAYYARDVCAFSAGIKCWHCSFNVILYLPQAMVQMKTVRALRGWMVLLATTVSAREVGWERLARLTSAG